MDIVSIDQEDINLARAIAWTVIGSWPNYWEREEGFSDAMVGLVQAKKSYDPSKGANFTTYASFRIRGAILDGWRARHGKRGNGVFTHDPPTLPISQGKEPDGEMRLPQIPDPAALFAFDEIEDRELKTNLLYALCQLPSRTQLVVVMYFYDNMTLREIGEVLGFSEGRASQIVKGARERVGRIMIELGMAS